MTEFLLAVVGLFLISAVLVSCATAFVFRKQLWPERYARNSWRFATQSTGYSLTRAYFQRVAEIEQSNGLTTEVRLLYVQAYEERSKAIQGGRAPFAEVNPIASPQGSSAFVTFVAGVFELNMIQAHKIPSYA
ncbi:MULTISPECIES: hypothetical protein [unclassified Variovorax]|uniref:hypothetical protein n=1 Tax=unclassified Variovorax TaxID=663243 RepID=UPI003F46ECDB